MPKRPKVSVVLPVYNPGEGIARCLGRLRDQTLREIELIFVDDCGTDGAMDLVRAAAQEDERIRIITQPENMGAGPARNAGIEAARGEYMSFVDPDDFVAPDFLELLYTKARAEGLDIVKGRIVHMYEGADSISERLGVARMNAIVQSLEAGEPLYMCFRHDHHTALYRRAFLLRSGARYGLSRNGEDTTFLLRASHAAESFGLCSEALYYYVQRSGSAKYRFDERRLREQLLALREEFDYLSAHLADDPFARKYARDRVDYYLQLQIRAADFTGLEEAAARFLEETRAETLRLPFAGELAESSFRIRALLKHGVNLCEMPMLTQEGTPLAANEARIVANWVDFALAHPDFSPSLKAKVADVLQRAYRFYADMVARRGATGESAAFYLELRRQSERWKNSREK